MWTIDPLGNIISLFYDDTSSANIDAKLSPLPVSDEHPPSYGASRQRHVTLLRENIVLESTHCLIEKPKRKIGILTSGGDSSGMNAAIRSITRYSLQRDCQPFAIFEGYNGYDFPLQFFYIIFH